MKNIIIILLVFVLNYGFLGISKAADLTKLKSFINIIVANKQGDKIKLNELKGTITSTLTLAIEKTKDLPATNEKKKDLLEILNYFLSKVDNTIKNPRELGGGGNLAGEGGALASNVSTGTCSFTKMCKEGDFCRIKTGQCFPLVHKDWGFRGFSKSGKTINVGCSGTALQNAINNAGAGDLIKVAACTLSGKISIKKDNVIIRGAGIGKTTLNGMFEVAAKNIIISDFTINASGMIGAIDAYYNTGGNLLFERIEAYGAGRAGNIKITKHPYTTVRYSKTSNSLHGINNKMSNKSQIYSNESFNNSNYGMDGSTVDELEVAGNYFHNNKEAGTKTPNAKRIYYHHNDMNNNAKAGIVYYKDGNNSASEFGRNNLTWRGELTLEYNDLTGNPVGFNGVWARNQLEQMNFLKVRYNKMDKFNCKKCGTIEIWGNNGTLDQQNSQVIRH